MFRACHMIQLVVYDSYSGTFNRICMPKEVAFTHELNELSLHASSSNTKRRGGKAASLNLPPPPPLLIQYTLLLNNDQSLNFKLYVDQYVKS